ncbi:MAG TPA: glycoside hydrolase family 130 protein [Pirellulaceae bacterium]|nr:glycoside hydrolase family 130 protein [Pirellulaceae bacterium]
MDTAIAPPARPPLVIERLPVRFGADSRVLITRPFFPGGADRVHNVLTRVLSLSDDEVERVLTDVLASFQHRHRALETVFDEHFHMAAALVGHDSLATRTLSPSRRRLIGSYFTMEYSLASAALFNPSIVPHPNQHNVPEGGKRFILSLRATGEGHLSSIVFRTGIIHADYTVSMDAPPTISYRLRKVLDRQYEKKLFWRKLREMRVEESVTNQVMNLLPDNFTYQELERALTQFRQHDGDFPPEQALEGIRWLARENYQLEIPQDMHISQQVIFPQSDSESRGIEDLRMVAFRDDDGTTTYYGTYTAFDGYRILPQIMATTDLKVMHIHTLNGKCVQNKGMALFPRRVKGLYCMCGRIDGENLYIMFSDNVDFWGSAERLRSPVHPWEFMQLGNCGSPLETPEGWLLLTHGVGPMRRYCIGAMLLDLNDPLRVRGYLNEPLLMPTEEEREGYVPNVVYTCGAMLHGDVVFIPYAMSDAATGFARVSLPRLLDRLLN